jgi:hypothetical protein
MRVAFLTAVCGVSESCSHAFSDITLAEWDWGAFSHQHMSSGFIPLGEWWKGWIPTIPLILLQQSVGFSLLLPRGFHGQCGRSLLTTWQGHLDSGLRAPKSKDEMNTSPALPSSEGGWLDRQVELSRSEVLQLGSEGRWVDSRASRKKSWGDRSPRCQGT